MEAKKIIYLLALAIAVLAIFFGFSCNREESDTIPPSVPFGLNATAATTSITLSWSASSDNVGVSGYKVFRDGVAAGNATSTSFTDKNLVPNSSYVYTVSAFDANGNVSELSTPYTAKTVDDCPTCSKWMTEINFTQPTVDIINADEAKSAGSLMVKNISTSTHTANLTLTFSGAGASAVDSLNYTIGGQTTKQKVENNSVTLNQISVPANNSTEIKLVYRIKEVIPAGIVDQSQITFALTATTTDESGVTQPGNRIFPNVALDKLKVYTAKIDATKSYEASAVAEDKILFGNSVAKAFVLEVTTPGTVRLEAIGKLSDGTSAIKYFWVNGADHSDFNVSVSTLSPIVSKTTFGNNNFIEVNLKAGTNVIAFKTNPYSGKIANNAEVGLKVTGSGFSMTNESYTANSVAANLAAIVKVWSTWAYNFWIPAKTIALDQVFSSWRFSPLNENRDYDGNSYPKIEKMAIDTRFWIQNYPGLVFTKTEETPSSFEENFRVLGINFGNNMDIHGIGTVFAKDLANNSVKYENNMIYFSGPAVQTAVHVYDFGGFSTRVNFYNASNQQISALVGGFDPYPAEWKFTGNPELELWTHAEESVSKRIQ